MNHPQSYAEKIYQQFPTVKLKSIKDYGCCAFVLLWCLGYEPEDIEAILTLGRMIDKKVIDVDCTVYWSPASEYVSGRKINVEKIAITTIKGIKERTPVMFSYNGKSHWVGVENGKIAFNPLENSVCVNKGKPVTCRKITLAA